MRQPTRALGASPSSLRRRERGFSIIELLLAAFILSIGLLGLGALQVTSQSQGTNSRFRGTAALIAHNVLDQMQAEGAVTAAQRLRFGVITLPATPFTYIGNADATAQASTPGPSFTILGLLPTDPYYVANPTAPTDITFTTTWSRNAGSVVLKKVAPVVPPAPPPAGPAPSVSAIQECIVNVSWNEFNNQTKAIDAKFITVSRHVRM